MAAPPDDNVPMGLPVFPDTRDEPAAPAAAGLYAPLPVTMPTAAAAGPHAALAMAVPLVLKPQVVQGQAAQGQAAQGQAALGSDLWVCSQCTVENHGGATCDMCYVNRPGCWSCARCSQTNVPIRNGCMVAGCPGRNPQEAPARPPPSATPVAAVATVAAVAAAAVAGAASWWTALAAPAISVGPPVGGGQAAAPVAAPAVAAPRAAPTMPAGGTISPAVRRLIEAEIEAESNALRAVERARLELGTEEAARESARREREASERAAREAAAQAEAARRQADSEAALLLEQVEAARLRLLLEQAEAAARQEAANRQHVLPTHRIPLLCTLPTHHLRTTYASPTVVAVVLLLLHYLLTTFYYTTFYYTTYAPLQAVAVSQ